MHSVLDDITGIGPKRRKALMKQFGDLEKIKEASIEELSSVEGMTQKTAEEVFRFFHKK